MLIPIWLPYAVLALSLWGFTGLTQKLSTNNASAELSFIAYSAAFVPIAGIILWWQPLDWNIPARGWLLAVLGGALSGFAVLSSFAAYRSGGKASVVTPLIALFPVVTVVLAVLMLGERLGMREIIGVITAVAAAAALSYEKDSNPIPSPDAQGLDISLQATHPNAKGNDHE